MFLYHERLRHGDSAARGVRKTESPLRGPRRDCLFITVFMQSNSNVRQTKSCYVFAAVNQVYDLQRCEYVETNDRYGLNAKRVEFGLYTMMA